MMLKIASVEAIDGHKLHVIFTNGDARIFDASPYLDKGVFVELRNPAYFRRVRAIGSGVEWPNEQDLSADTLHICGEPVAATKS